MDRYRDRMNPRLKARLEREAVYAALCAQRSQPRSVSTLIGPPMATSHVELNARGRAAMASPNA